MKLIDKHSPEFERACREASAKRIARIRKALQDREADACYVRKTSNIAWASAFTDVFDEEEAHALIITQDEAFIHSDSRYVSALEQAAVDTQFAISIAPGGHAAFLASVLEPDARVLVEDTLMVREFRQLEERAKESSFQLILAEGFIEALREVKDELEVSLMRCAQRITDEAFASIRQHIRAGMTEVQVQRMLDSFMYEAGADGLAFPTIVAAGAHAASPHAIPGERPLRVGDAVVMDFGARYAGYCSDMTRTVFIGEASEELREAWGTLRRANETCEDAIRAGKTGAEIHEMAERILAESGFAGRMGHGLGHSLGLDIHEDPPLSPRNSRPLPAGALVTVEPGIYVPGEFGMRLEDFGLITDEGFEVLTQSTHEMVIIEQQISSQAQSSDHTRKEKRG